MIRLLGALMFAVLAGSAWAATPIKITADKFSVDDAAQEATFEGNVLVVRDGLQLTANKLVVKYGVGGMSDISFFTALGSVRITTKGQDATGNKAVFEPDTQLLTITENVRVQNAIGEVSGPELVINLETNQSVFSGSNKNRVTGVFTPQ